MEKAMEMLPGRPGGSTKTTPAGGAADAEAHRSTGAFPGPRMEEALARMERGEDRKIEEEMGDSIGGG